MTNTRSPLLWARYIQAFFIVLVGFVIAFSDEEPLAFRLLCGILAAAFLAAGIRRLWLRKPVVEDKDPTVSVLLLGLALLVLGSLALISEFDSLHSIFGDPLRQGGPLISLAMLPVGLVSVVLVILDFVLHK